MKEQLLTQMSKMSKIFTYTLIHGGNVIPIYAIQSV